MVDVTRRGRPRWWGALALGVVAAAGAGLFLWGGDGAADDGDTALTSTTIPTGGLDVDAPDGWEAIPLRALGFGLALPEDWESVVLSGDGLARIAEAAPVVPGFVDAAHAAAGTGSVFYAAGVDDAGHVTDLKVRAAADAGVDDPAGLEDYARRLATEAHLTDPTVTVVEDVPWPTVEVRYSTPAPSADESATEGTERSVLAPNGVVYSLLVTSEDPAGHDELADRLFGTLALAPADAPEADDPDAG
ncbi:MAG TPA: hypothetical protein VGO78_02480 [Acidimicrobiales bacterium]|nr:hypothetical protein [Acidimicrobiales bacterium]